MERPELNAQLTAALGIRPSLAELIALRQRAQGRPGARKGTHGVQALAPSRLLGRGMEYAESRRYVAGDDARQIDWRVTARTGHAHTKLFQAERERLTLIVADTASTLYFGTRVRFKSVQAARAGAWAAWQAIGDGDRVAALRGSSVDAPVPPGAGMRGALRVLDALTRWYATPPADDAGLAFALAQARRLLRPGSRLIVLADPASLLEVPESAWRGMAPQHDERVLLLTDPLERRPPALPLRFSLGPVGRVALDLGQASVRQRWWQAFDGVLERAVARLTQLGVAHSVLSSDGAVEAALAVRVPAAQRQGARGRRAG